MKSFPKNKARGFTLIELSLVIIGIGLLIGGVIVAKSMIDAAELRGLVSQIEKIDTAVNTFRLKYQCLPGDCATATNFFPSAGCPDGDGDPATTCNGDGSWYVNNSAAGTNLQRLEMWKFWQHLALAGLIKGQYTGVSGPGHATNNADIGLNVPATPVTGLGISLWHHLPHNSSWQAPLGTDRGMGIHFLYVGAERPDNSLTMMGRLTLQQVRSMDDKIDDGLANSGGLGVRAANASYNTTGCTSGSQPNFSYGTDLDALCNMVIFRNW